MGRSLVLIETKIGTVCTVHLESIDSAPVRIKQLKLISERISKCENVFFCGDFNYNGNDKTCEEEKYLPLGLKDDCVDSNTLGVNYPSKKFKPGRFDRLLYKSNLYQMQSNSLFGNEKLKISSNDMKEGYLKKIGPYLSDHLAVIGRFSKK